MEKFIVFPGHVRGGGNILNNRKVTDFNTNSNVFVSQRNYTINSESLPCYYLGDGHDNPYNYTGLSFDIDDAGHLILTTLDDIDVTFSINNQGHLIVTGTNEELYSIDSNGHCIYGG